jgi:hypothetical protein
VLKLSKQVVRLIWDGKVKLEGELPKEVFRRV